MFDRALQIVMEAEGGFVDHPSDPGGATSYGITEAVAREAGYEGDMRALPLDLAKRIYRERYWDAASCDAYPWPLSLYVFDAAVNQGVQPAIMMLQKSLGTAQDGIVGPTTRRLAAASTPWHHRRFLAIRLKRYFSTRSFDKFGEGWLIRVVGLAESGAK